jgi:hypothetical protein
MNTARRRLGRLRFPTPATSLQRARFRSLHVPRGQRRAHRAIAGDTRAPGTPRSRRGRYGVSSPSAKGIRTAGERLRAIQVTVSTRAGVNTRDVSALRSLLAIRARLLCFRETRHACRHARRQRGGQLNSGGTKPGANARAILLDTNALSYLVGPNGFFDDAQLAHIRALLRRDVSAGTTVFVATGPVLEELSPLAEHDPQKYAERVGLLRDLSGGMLLKQFYDRIKLEIRERGRIARKLAFHSPAETAEMWRAARVDLALAREGAVQASRRKAEHFDLDTGARAELAELWQRVPEDQGVTRNLFRTKLASIVEDWCRTDLEYFAAEGFGLSKYRDRWPAPREVPSLWRQRSFHLARLAGVMLDGRRLDGADVYDCMHFEDTVYAQAFVTQDQRLHDFAARAPDVERLEMVKFTDWAAALIAGRQ